jgi:hypothetical protein
MAHTEGKLRVKGKILVSELLGHGIAIAEYSINVSDETDLENARRLVACWNWFASIGISAEDIERSTNLSDKLRQERDEALDVLRKIAEWNEEYPADRIFFPDRPVSKKMKEINTGACAILAKHQKVTG